MNDAPSDRSSDVEIAHPEAPSDVLLAGFSTFGLAGLTAVNYVVDRLDLVETGHVTVDGIPTITPFENGVPRHHTRFFSRDDLDVTVLVGELFVPQDVATTFSDAISNWTNENDVSEIAIAAGVPVPHGPPDHRTFYIATEDYRERRLADVDVPPMGSGFLDGVNAALLSRGIGSPTAVGVYVTPVHAQVPDVEAAIRLVEAITAVYDLGVDTGPLQSFASEVERYYRDLAERTDTIAEEQRPGDRMYM